MKFPTLILHYRSASAAAAAASSALNVEDIDSASSDETEKYDVTEVADSSVSLIHYQVQETIWMNISTPKMIVIMVYNLGI